MSIEDEIKGKNTDDYTQDYTSGNTNPDGVYTRNSDPNNKRGTLMKWAGWLTIIFCAINIILAIFSILRYTSASFDWNEYLQMEYSGIDIDVNTVKAIVLSETIVSMVVKGIFIWLGIMYIKDAEIFDDNKFPKNKYIWISVLNIICVSAVSGIIGIVAAVSRNNVELFNTTSVNNDNKTTSSDVKISEVMQEKLLKLKKMKEDKIISEEEYKDLVAKVLDEGK